MVDSNKVQNTILQMATDRGTDKTICPSEVARALFGEQWRKHMDEVRAEAVELYKAGKVLMTQKGELVDPDHIKGPVRIRIKL